MEKQRMDCRKLAWATGIGGKGVEDEWEHRREDGCVEDRGRMKVRVHGWCLVALDPAVQSLVNHCWGGRGGSLHVVLDALVELY